MERVRSKLTCGINPQTKLTAPSGHGLHMSSSNLVCDSRETKTGAPCRQVIAASTRCCSAGHLVRHGQHATAGQSRNDDMGSLETGTISADEVLGTNPVVVDLIYGKTVTVTPGLLDEAAEEAFQYGQCHALAIVLAERLDRPIHALVEYFPYDLWWDEEFGDESESPSEEWLASHWGHAVIQVGPGSYLDVEGISDMDDLVATYGSPRDYGVCYATFEVTPKQLSRFWMYGYGVKPNLDVARTFVDPVLDRAQHSEAWWS